MAALVGAYYSAIFACASFLFGQDTANSVPAAAHLVPFNGSYIARLAAWQPAQREVRLHRAVELDPLDYQSWIQLGLTAEMQSHDPVSAERYYLRASAVNHMFLPKWTLTNFYFRQDQGERFFTWAKATLQISPYQADPVFAQMWLMSQDPERIARAIPDKPLALLEYTTFLANGGQFSAIPAIVKRLAPLVPTLNPSRDDQLFPAEDRILAAGQPAPALSVWRTMAQAGWIHLTAPTPESPVTNGDFSNTFLHHGFDWLPGEAEGITVEQSTQEKDVVISFSGDEPEHCVLLRQAVPLAPNTAYRLAWHAEAQAAANGNLDSPSGITWQLRPISASASPGIGAAEALGRAATHWEFESASSELYELSLQYARPLGKLRANGSFSLRSVVLQKIQ